MKMFNRKLFSIVCLVMAVLMMFSLAACKGGNNDTSTKDEASVSSDSTSADDTSTAGTDSSSTAETSTAETTVAETTVAETTAPKAVNPDGVEILGAGSKSQPYLETPDSNMTVKTVQIPAGKALYYDIYRVGGKYLTINDSDAYVIYNGTRYNSSGGSVSFVVGSALASDAVSFQIGNSSSSAKSFKISFYDVYGTYDNPEIIKKMDGKQITTTLYDGDDTGYTYKYTAEKDGIIRFYVKNSLDEFLFSATRNMYSDGLLIPVQSTFVDGVKTDDSGNYIEVEVLKGDTVMIGVSSYPMGAYYPAATVKWYGVYAN